MCLIAVEFNRGFQCDSGFLILSSSFSFSTEVVPDWDIKAGMRVAVTLTGVEGTYSVTLSKVGEERGTQRFIIWTKELSGELSDQVYACTVVHLTLRISLQLDFPTSSEATSQVLANEG